MEKGLGTQNVIRMLAVARKAEEYSLEIFGWEDEKCKEMFALAILAHVGFEYEYHYSDALAVSYQISASLTIDPKMQELIEKFGKPFGDEDIADEMFVLNLAHITVNDDGFPCPVSEHRRDIKWMSEGSNLHRECKRVNDLIDDMEAHAERIGGRLTKMQRSSLDMVMHYIDTERIIWNV